jgi:hypothetical protein
MLSVILLNVIMLIVVLTYKVLGCTMVAISWYDSSKCLLELLSLNLLIVLQKMLFKVISAHVCSVVVAQSLIPRLRVRIQNQESIALKNNLHREDGKCLQMEENQSE